MAIGVAVGLCAMITLLPALLVIFGRWVFWPLKPVVWVGRADRARRVGADRPAHGPPAPVVWLVAAVVLGVMALGVTGLEAEGLQSKDSFRTSPRRWPASRCWPVTSRPARQPGPGHRPGRGRDQLQAALAGTAGVTDVTPPVVKDGYAYIEGTLTSSADSQASYDLVDQLRATVHAIPGAEAKVGGGSAVNLDILRASRHDRNLVVPLVLVVVMIILGLVLRAIVAPCCWSPPWSCRSRPRWG